MSDPLKTIVNIVLMIVATVAAFFVGLLTSSIAAGVCTLGGLSLLFGRSTQTRSKQQASSINNQEPL